MWFLWCCSVSSVDQWVEDQDGDEGEEETGAYNACDTNNVLLAIREKRCVFTRFDCTPHSTARDAWSKWLTTKMGAVVHY